MLESSYKAGVSNLFDRRAKCTNFKLVRGQTADSAKIEVEGEGNGEGVSPSPAD